MRGTGTIRKALTAMLVLAIALWAEAGLALLTGDQVMQCPMMKMAQGQASAMADADDAMACCPADPGHTPKVAAGHPPCCSSNDVTEQPLALLVNSDRLTSHPLDTVAAVAGSFVPPLAEPYGELRSADAPRFVKPVLDLKADLRI
jgi:hypothetical protein